MAGNPSKRLIDSSLLPRKRGRPKKDTRPTSCENASSNSSGTGSFGHVRLAQDENYRTNTNEICRDANSDVTLRKRGRPMFSTELPRPSYWNKENFSAISESITLSIHNSNLGDLRGPADRGGEIFLTLGIQNQLNQGLGTLGTMHGPREPLSEITKNGNVSFILCLVLSYEKFEHRCVY
ncbi:hypothetical protein ACET3Z_001186 [Daucus carota]